MDVSFRIKDAGEVKLFLQPIDKDTPNGDERPHEFILVRCQEDYDNPYIKLVIDNSGNYDIVQSRDIVEEEGFLREKHLIDAEYEDRPLSKLTKDILDLLGIRRG